MGAPSVLLEEFQVREGHGHGQRITGRLGAWSWPWRGDGKTGQDMGHFELSMASVQGRGVRDPGVFSASDAPATHSDFQTRADARNGGGYHCPVPSTRTSPWKYSRPDGFQKLTLRYRPGCTYRSSPRALNVRVTQIK